MSGAMMEHIYWVASRSAPSNPLSFLQDPEDRYAQLDGNLWKLVWSDEFSDGIITTDKWTFEVGGGFGEDQQYRNEPFVVGS